MLLSNGSCVRVILEVEVLDKRHVGMKSSTMEKKAFYLSELMLTGNNL